MIKYDKLITSLRTAYITELDLEKKQTSYDDLLDALRLSLKVVNSPMKIKKSWYFRIQ